MYRSSTPRCVLLEAVERKGRLESPGNRNECVVQCYNSWMPPMYERLSGMDDAVEQFLMQSEQPQYDRALLELRIALSCYLRAASRNMTDAEGCIWLIALARNRRGSLWNTLPRDIFLMICDMVLVGDKETPTGKCAVHFKMRLACETGRHCSVLFLRLFQERQAVEKGIVSMLPFKLKTAFPELLNSQNNASVHSRRRRKNGFRKIRQKARDEKVDFHSK